MREGKNPQESNKGNNKTRLFYGGRIINRGDSLAWARPLRLEKLSVVHRPLIEIKFLAWPPLEILHSSPV